MKKSLATIAGRAAQIVATFFLILGLLPVAPAAAATLPLPKMDNGMSGFGGFITKVTPCICADLGVLISVAGPFGGDYLFSFSKPPSIKIGSFFSVAGPILGATKGGGTCGTDRSHGDCINKKSGKIITYIGGIM